MEKTELLSQLRIDRGNAEPAASRAGLWVGGAAVTQVSQYLKSYARDGSNNLVITTNGNYVVTNLDTTLATVPRAYPLRLIVHNPTNGNAVLLQRVYYGFDATTNVVVASGECRLARSRKRQDGQQSRGDVPGHVRPHSPLRRRRGGRRRIPTASCGEHARIGRVKP